MAEETFDLIVIGAGPGGYVCAIRAAQLGLKTALVEKSNTLGGTCLNVGCIPSKALLHASEMMHFTRHGASNLGIKIEKVEVDLPAMMKKKDQTVATLVGGVKAVVTKKGAKVIHGTGKIIDATTVEVTDEKNKSTLKTRHIVIATGSAPATLPSLPFDGETIVHSTHALEFTRAPKHLVVVGGGAIGLELGSVWARLGSQVTVVEFLPRIAPTFDDDVSKALERSLKKQGMSFELDTKVTGYKKKKGKGVVLTAERGKDTLEFEADKVLVAIGRIPFTEGLGLEEAGVELDSRQRIKTDAHFKTSVPGIFAIGDAIAGPMLAHKAEEEGVAVAEQIAGKAGHVNYDVIPNIIYTDPEVCSAGLTEKEAREQGFEFKTGKFPFTANGRALANDSTEGFIKVVADAKTDRLLGVQMIGRQTSELIAAAVTHLEYGGSAEDVARTVHAHPTLSEAFKEAALAVDKRAIHSL